MGYDAAVEAAYAQRAAALGEDDEKPTARPADRVQDERSPTA